jgi:hypothetical protein
VDAIVLEVADGVYQGETAHLLRSAVFAERVDGLLFAAADAVGAAGAVSHLGDLDVPLIAISGVITISPLASREARMVCPQLPVVDTAQLSDPAELTALIPEKT